MLNIRKNILSIFTIPLVAMSSVSPILADEPRFNRDEQRVKVEKAKYGGKVPEMLGLSEVPSPPDCKGKKTKKALKKCMQDLHEYYAIVGRPRFLLRSASQPSLTKSVLKSLNETVSGEQNLED